MSSAGPRVVLRYLRVRNGEYPLMSDYDDATMDDTDSESESKGRAQIRELEKRARRADELEARLAAFERKDALTAAGVDLSTPAGQMFAKWYDGDTDPAKVREAAEQMGVLAGAAPKADGPTLEPGEESQSDERSALASGAEAEQGRVQDPDPIQAAIAHAQEQIKLGVASDNAIADAIGMQMAAAARGDRRAMWDPAAV